MEGRGMDDTVKKNIISAFRSGQTQEIQTILVSLESEPRYVEYCKVALFEACRVGSVDIVEYLVCRSTCSLDSLVNCADENGETPLHIASKLLDKNVCRVILNTDACKVNIQSISGQTPLHFAVGAEGEDELESKVEIVQLLLAIPDCDPNIRNSDGDTPLILACKPVNHRVICALVANDKCNINIEDNDGNTALHFAVVKSNESTANTLLCHKRYRPDLTNKLGETPLHIACSKLNIRIVTVLLKEGRCDVNAQTHTGRTPLHLVLTAQLMNEGDGNPLLLPKRVCEQELKENISHLLLKVPNCDPHIADAQDVVPIQIAYKTNIFVVTLILEKACKEGYSKRNEVMEQALTLTDNNLLHLLVRLRATGCIKPVMQLQGSTDIINRVEALSGDTPLITAIRAESVEAVELLLDSQYCDLDGRTASRGDTPLIVACRMTVLHQTVGSLHILNTLLSNDKCSVNAQNDNGNTALHFVAAGNCEGVKAIVRNERYAPNIANKDGIAPLHVACSKLQMETVKVLLEAGRCNVNLQTSTGQTPLHMVVVAENDQKNLEIEFKVQIVQLLLAMPSGDPNIRNSRGDTPLIIVCKLDNQMFNYRIVSALTTSDKCDPNIQDNDGNTAVHLAVRKHHHEVVKDLILCPSYEPDLLNKLGETPLHIACSQLNLQTVTVLLEEGRCDVNAQNNTGQTPLHVVLTAKRKSKQDKRSIATVLLDVPRCDPLTADANGVTPLKVAHKLGIKTFLLILERAHAKGNEVLEQAMALTNNSLLYLACYYQATTVLRNVLKMKIIPAIVNKVVASKWDAPLIAAIRTRNVEAVELLLDYQFCDPNVKSVFNGDTPLIVTCKMAAAYQTKTWFQILHLLLSNDKCDLNSQNNIGNTGLHIAAAGRCQEVVDALVGHERCTPDIVNNQGETPLHVACRELNLSAVSAFWKCNINANLQTKSGQTPLHLVVGAQEVEPGSKLELIHLILSNPERKTRNFSAQATILHSQEWDPNVRNSSGDTPLHIAVETNTSDILAALLQNKQSDPNVQNDSGETPLHIACKLRKYDCMITLTTNKRCNVNIPNNNGRTALHKAIYNMHPNDLSLIEHLISNSQCDVTACDYQGNTALHIACTKGAWKQDESIISVIRLLLSTGKVDPQCVNNAGETPIQLAISNKQIVQELSSFSTAQLDHPVQSFVKMFVVGNAETGKSTLVESVRTDASRSRRFVPSQFKTVKGVKPHTAGIIPIPVNNHHFGNAVIYDFAGQHEYYSSHAAVLENLVLSSPPVFLLTVNLSEPFDCICETVSYWWSFIGSYASRSRSSPHVIIIGSHKDVVKSRGEKVQEILDRLLATMKDIPTKLTLVDCVALDCRIIASEGLTKLLSMLKHTCETVRRDVKIDLRCHILSSFLSDTLSERMACTLAEIVHTVKAEKNTLLPQSTADLVNLLAALSDKDRILLLKNSERLEYSWIILQRQKLFGDINGSIFAPEYFDEYVPDFAGNTGIVSVSKMSSHFPQYPLEVITGFLSHLQFCFKIGDEQMLELITTDENGFAPDEQFYFFPALVSCENPPEESVWDVAITNRQLRRRYGWFCECSRRYQYLMSRFLHVLILRLAFSYALAMEHEPYSSTVVRRRCSVWKRGIAWKNNDGIETVVEVGQRNQWVAVMMQCPAGMEAECTKLRRSVIQTVLGAKEEFCPDVAMSEYLMHPGITDYPFQRKNQLPLYSMKEVCKVMIEGKAYVLDKVGLQKSALAELLPCEPYIGLGKQLMSHLFASHYAQKAMPDHVLSEFAQRLVCSNPETYQHKVKLLSVEVLPSVESFFPPSGSSECVGKCTHILQQVTPITFQNLREALSGFSILCGRNPWELSEISPATEILESKFSDSEFGHHLEEADDSLLGIESLLEVRTEVVPAVSHTASLGLALGLSQASKLQVIQHDWPDNVAFQLTEIMAAWLQGMGKSSWRSLAKALMDPAVGCPVIAQAMREHHPTHTHCSDTNEDDALFQQVDEAPLDETSLGDILSTVVQGGHYSWFHLGLVLGLHYGTLKIIQNEHASYTECVAVVITKWLNQVDSVRRRGQPSWRVLARALAHPLVGQYRLADGIARDHPAQEDTSTSVDMSLSESADTSAGSPQSLGPLPPSLSTTHPPPCPSTSSSPSH